MIGMKMNLWRPFALALALLLSTTVHAEAVNDLYTAETPVKGQGAQARAAGQREAFAKVLVKVSGDRSLPGKSAFAKALNDANSYVRQYSYRAMQAEPETTPNSEDAPDRLLRVQFDETAVNQLLLGKGVPVWGSSRPLALIWLGIERSGQRSLYQAEGDPDLRAALDQVADARGLPILLPLMDLEDRANLQVSDVWGVFETAIRRASERYMPDVILVGRLRHRGGSDWLADWSLFQADTVKHWQSHARSRRAVATEGMQEMVDKLAARYAPRAVAQSNTTLRLRVAGLNHLADYLLVKDYLSSLDSIQAMDLLSASPTEISFLVRVLVDRETLDRGIMLGRVLESLPPRQARIEAGNGPVEELDQQSLNYQLRQ
jgi:hypothetical protein